MNVVRSRRPHTLLLLACVVAISICFASASTASAESVSSAASAIPLATPLPQKAWTIMVYIDGDNDLEKYVTLDIERELCEPGSNADVNVVCVADRTPGYDKSRGDWTGTKLFYCMQGMTADAHRRRRPTGASATWAIRRR